MEKSGKSLYDSQELYRELIKAFPKDENGQGLLSEADLKGLSMELLTAIRTVPGPEFSPDVEKDLYSEKYVPDTTCLKFDPAETISVLSGYFTFFRNEPEDGWIRHTKDYLRNRIFPHMPKVKDAEQYREGREIFLKVLKAEYTYEDRIFPSNPVRKFDFPDIEEIKEDGTASEFCRLLEMYEAEQVYEFMRLAQFDTGFNTLEHIAGVHFVAMYVGRKLKAAGVPVDLALLSGAAAFHDIGKYGCKEEESTRVPYLHYYYTDTFLERMGLPRIAHVAANHSTWDLELENLSAESLILIYADFRTRSRRDEEGREIICFHTLEEAYDIILHKLSNVTDKKMQRYREVYGKLSDFQDFFLSKLDQSHDRSALLRGHEIIRHLKFEAIDHNIRLMDRFNREEDFAELIEDARGEKKRYYLRTYIDIFSEYSSYMTEKQKGITLAFLYECLTDAESDIRIEAARIMGRITSNFSEVYKKELPKNVRFGGRKEENLTLFGKYINAYLWPDYKFTKKHALWIIRSLPDYVMAVLENAEEEDRQLFADKLKEPVLRIDRQDRSEINRERMVVLDYISELIGTEMHFQTETESADWDESAPSVGKDLTDREIYGIFLENQKSSTHWMKKINNIRLLMALPEEKKENYSLQFATHFSNLLKLSETVAVRRKSGDALLEIMKDLPEEQRSEMAIELLGGLDIEDYQFSKYIPEYLGRVINMLRDPEKDNLFSELRMKGSSKSEKTAALAMDTWGYAIENGEDTDRADISFLMKGVSSSREGVSSEALRVIGRNIFGSRNLDENSKKKLMESSAKKLMLLFTESDNDRLSFYDEATALNNIYRFISRAECRDMDLEPQGNEKIAFFPGTFDPFSLSHKEICKKIRDMGFEVYVSLDDFSWSKNTAPYNYRKRIIEISLSDEANVCIFPENIPVNIARDKDIRKLLDIFKGREFYIVTGEDVIKKASAYNKKKGNETLLTLNHIVIRRNMAGDDEEKKRTDEKKKIKGRILDLSLPEAYGEISSTKIRENIDNDRDISNLVDAEAMNYIYRNHLYLREATYREEIPHLDLNRTGADWHIINGDDYFEEFKSADRAALVRNNCHGKTAVIKKFAAADNSADTAEILFTELMSRLAEEGCTSCVYNPEKWDEDTDRLFTRSGFMNLSREQELPLYVTDMSEPTIIFKNTEMRIKGEFRRNPVVKRALSNAHNRLMETLSDIYPGRLILTYRTDVINEKIVSLVKKEQELDENCMALPFGKTLSNVLVPGTVTVSLHTEKYFDRELSEFSVGAMKNYPDLTDQMRAIASFERDVILIDDLLYKGYRMKKVVPVVKDCGINIRRAVFAVMTGEAEDRMKEAGIPAGAAYRLPKIDIWISESDCYPFIGGDSVEETDGESVNFILPYTSYSFVGREDREKAYKYSMSCLYGAREILMTLESEYQKLYGKKLTLQRLGEVIDVARKPLLSRGIDYNSNMSPSKLIENDIRAAGLLNKLKGK